MVRVVATGAEDSQFKAAYTRNLLKAVFTKYGMGTRVSSEPGKVKVVRKRSGDSP